MLDLFDIVVTALFADAAKVGKHARLGTSAISTPPRSSSAAPAAC